MFDINLKRIYEVVKMSFEEICLIDGVDGPEFIDAGGNSLDDPNYDDHYDRWRDDQGDGLREDIINLISKWVKTEKHTYYKGNNTKFKEHVKSILEVELK